jgi:hypothetical protein
MQIEIEVMSPSKAIRTAPLSKRISKVIFRPSHQEFSPLYQLLPHPYLLYVILYINNHLISSFLSLSLSSSSFTGAHKRSVPVACYCSKRYCSVCYSIARCSSFIALFSVQSGLSICAADSLKLASPHGSGQPPPRNAMRGVANGSHSLRPTKP